MPYIKMLHHHHVKRHGDGVTFWFHEIVLAQGERQKEQCNVLQGRKLHMTECTSTRANWEGTTLLVISTEWMEVSKMFSW